MAEKCHSAGTPKSDLWKHSYESYLPGGCPEKPPNVRTVLYLLCAKQPNLISKLTYKFSVVTYLVCFAAMQKTIMPSDGVWRNAADKFLLIKLIVFFQGTLFFDYKYQVIDSTEQEKTTHQNHTIFSAVNVPSVYAVFTDLLVSLTSIVVKTLVHNRLTDFLSKHYA